MNLKLSLKPEDLAKLVPVLMAARVYVVGAALIGVFGYTAWVVNAALNVPPSAPTQAAAPTVTFDKPTIQSLKSLNVVQGNVPTGNLGSGSPF